MIEEVCLDLDCLGFELALKLFQVFIHITDEILDVEIIGDGMCTRQFDLDVDGMERFCDCLIFEMKECLLVVPDVGGTRQHQPCK
eukprot:2332058-Ditylum_brightwellii.AAC.1